MNKCNNVQNILYMCVYRIYLCVYIHVCICVYACLYTCLYLYELISCRQLGFWQLTVYHTRKYPPGHPSLVRIPNIFCAAAKPLNMQPQPLNPPPSTTSTQQSSTLNPVQGTLTPTSLNHQPATHARTLPLNT